MSGSLIRLLRDRELVVLELADRRDVVVRRVDPLPERDARVAHPRDARAGLDREERADRGADLRLGGG